MAETSFTPFQEAAVGPDFNVKQEPGGYTSAMGDDIYTGGGYDPNSNVEGPLAPLETNQFKTEVLKYPSNLESGTRAHWISFTIFTAELSTDTSGGTKTIGQSNVAGTNFTVAKGTTGVTDGPGGGIDSPTTAVGAMGMNNTEAIQDEGFLAKIQGGAVVRNTTRINQFIALYMPETVNVQYSQNWQSESLTDALGNLGYFGSLASALGSKITGSNKTKSLAGPIIEGLSKATGFRDFGNFALYGAGYAVNPQLEVLYKGTDMRTFQFDFLFSPKDDAEAKTVIGIIKTFRFHQAPEISSDTVGRFFIPPSEFEIDFFSGNDVNPNINKIGRVVMTGLNVDYAPNGWSAFKNSQGMPTSIRLTLQFMEKELVTKQRIKNDNF